MNIRLNIYDENNKWVGQEYLTENGKWLHRWTLNGKLERGSWRGRAKGDNELNWRYESVGITQSMHHNEQGYVAVHK